MGADIFDAAYSPILSTRAKVHRVINRKGADVKVLLIGAAGTLGRSVHEALRERGHQVVTASRGDPELTVDITDPASIRSMYDKVGTVDAVSPTVFVESLAGYGYTFAGFEPVPVRRAANAYIRSIEGRQTGQIYVVE